jgi:gliding motility-associated-like protein
MQLLGKTGGFSKGLGETGIKVVRNLFKQQVTFLNGTTVILGCNLILINFLHQMLTYNHRQVALIFALFLPLVAQAQFETFQKEYKTKAFTQCYDIAPTPDGGYVISGLEDLPTVPLPGTSFVTKIGCDGEPEWTKRFGAVSGLDNIDHKVVVSANNEIFLMTSEGIPGGYDILLVKLDANGNTVWRNLYGGSGEDTPGGITLLSDGDIVVTGITNSFGANVGTPYGDLYVLKVDGGTGSVVWSATFGFSGTISRGYGVVENDLGGVAVTGTVFHAPTVANWAPLLQLDADGNLVDAKFYGLDNRNTNAQDIVRSADGGYILSGFSNILGVDWFDILTLPFVLKTDAAGILEWGSVIDGTPNASGLGGIAYTPVDNGDTIGVAIETYFYQNQTSDPTKRVLCLLGSADGSLLNARQYNLEGGQFPRLKEDRDGGYIMSAFTDENNGSDPDDQFWVGPIINKLDKDFNSGCNETDRTAVTSVMQPSWTTTSLTFDLASDGVLVSNPAPAADSFALFLPEVETFCEQEWAIGGDFSFTQGPCEGDTVRYFADLLSPAYLEIFWDYGDGMMEEGGETTAHVYDLPGTYEAQLAVVYCEDTLFAVRSITIEEENYEAIIAIDTGACVIDPVMFTLAGGGSGDYEELSWDFGDGMIEIGGDIVEHTYEEPGTYEVELTVTYCEDDYLFTEEVEVIPCVEPIELTCEEIIPNAFSPNADGTNDGFCVLETDKLNSLNLQIYSRWGELIYDSNDLDACWDGTQTGEVLPPDVFAYRLQVETLDGEVLQCQGEVSLLR